MTSKIRLFALAPVLALALAACGGPLKYQLRGSPKAPDADAKVVADVDDKGGMTRLEIEVKNLAPPDRLQSGGKSFVVWARGGSSKQWTRVAALRYDDGDRAGTLLGASVPEMKFDLVITVEENTDAASPSPAIIFEQRVER
jgi:hypothetical protein